jgi:glycosyltransferase involved in cell wall biosynthesis
MFSQTNSLFRNRTHIPESAKIVIVADLFVDEYVGGAELTTQALIDAAPFEVHTIKSRELSLELIKQGTDKFWIFGNFADLNPQLIPTIVANLKYTILEYDYKYCRYRSPEKHQEDTGAACDCHEQMNGKVISAFFYGAMGMWWMSERQKERYLSLFPFLAERTNIVLSSVFSDETLGAIELLRQNQPSERKGWIVLGSNSWVKGFQAAKDHCEKHNLDYEIVWNVPYEQLLAKLSVAEGFVYLPAGADTCPRMVIEAKLLGCQLVLNDNVQHRTEDWFATNDIQSISDYLYASKRLFWNGVREMMEYRPKVSGYTTTYNCIQQKYPFEQCIRSMLQFCNEVCIVDGGSQDGTLEQLVRILLEFKEEPLLNPTDEQVNDTVALLLEAGQIAASFGSKNVRLKVIKRDWKHPRFAVFDGMQKAEARKMCTGDFVWQMDSDEVVHEEDAPRISELCRLLPKDVDILSLPVIEYWGGSDKVRCDVMPWKWRLSRNKPNITHGIPMALRRYDVDGNLCSAPGSDGCDMIDAVSGQPVPHVSFYTQDAEQVRRVAMSGNVEALKEYERWFNEVVENLPGVHHYSWYDLHRKIRLYRDYWTHHWVSLTGAQYVDTASTNMMFDVPWSQVTDDMIDEKVEALKNIGGHIWHSKWQGEQTPWITVKRSEPAIMLAKETVTP